MERALAEELIDIGELKLNVAWGPSNGPPLLLLHGGSAGWQVWAPIVAALSDEWRVVAPDLRGHGKSGRSVRYRIVDYAQDVAALVDGSLDQRPVIVGHSLGAHVAAAVAVERPDLVHALVLGDAPFDLERLRRHVSASRAQNEAWRELSASGATPSEIAARLPDAPTSLPGGWLGRIGDVVPAGASWYVEMAAHLARLDPAMLDAVIEFEEMHRGVEQRLPRVTCPVLFVQGDPGFGGLLADAEVERWLNEPRGDRRVSLEGVGHGLFMQAPERFTLAIRSFLHQVRAAPPLLSG